MKDSTRWRQIILLTESLACRIKIVLVFTFQSTMLGVKKTECKNKVRFPTLEYLMISNNASLDRLCFSSSPKAMSSGP